jgi:hypothetical protein
MATKFMRRRLPGVKILLLPLACIFSAGVQLCKLAYASFNC